jgi:trimethylamine--corrinoid protein Co-methyltransferase
MNTANAIAFRSLQFAVLSDSQLEDFHLAALELLRRTGVRFFNQGALDLIKDAGGYISDGNLVKFPAHMVEDAIASAPGRIVLSDRDGEPTMFIEGTKTYFGTGSDCLNVLDPETGEHRKFTRADIINSYHVCDALPNIAFVMSNGIPIDVEYDLAYDVQMVLMLEHTTKPIVFVTNDLASCQRAIDMAAAVAGGYEALAEQQHILLYSEPSSPLQQTQTAVDKLLLMAEYRLPIVHSPSPLMGGTGPITMAGGLVLALAEILSSLAVHQLKQPGAPFVFGAGVHHIDMRAAQICYASPEFQITKAAIAELGRWYGIPTWGYAGCSDAKVMDEQAALESMLSVIMAKLSGANLIHDVGYMESGLTISYEMIVLTDELIALTDTLMKGIDISDDTLMLDEVHSVGPGGQFLDTELTLQRFRNFWYPGLLDRSIREQWLEAGATTLGQRLNARVKEILKEHHPKPLEKEKKGKLQEILARAAEQIKAAKGE